MSMKFHCRHCDSIVFSEPYRVVSEENGVVLLDMMVCRPCYEQAKALGLRSQAMPIDSKSRRVRRSWAHASA